MINVLEFFYDMFLIFCMREGNPSTQLQLASRYKNQARYPGSQVYGLDCACMLTASRDISCLDKVRYTRDHVVCEFFNHALLPDSDWDSSET